MHCTKYHIKQQIAKHTFSVVRLLFVTCLMNGFMCLYVYMLVFSLELQRSSATCTVPSLKLIRNRLHLPAEKKEVNNCRKLLNMPECSTLRKKLTSGKQRMSSKQREGQRGETLIQAGAICGSRFQKWPFAFPNINQQVVASTVCTYKDNQ